MTNVTKIYPATLNDIILKISKEKDCFQGMQNQQAERHYFIIRKVHLGVRDRISGDFSPQLEACTLDISASGIRLLTETALDPDTRYDVDMKNFQVSGQFVRIRVVKCKQLLHHTFEITAVFLEQNKD